MAKPGPQRAPQPPGGNNTALITAIKTLTTAIGTLKQTITDLKGAVDGLKGGGGIATGRGQIMGQQGQQQGASNSKRRDDDSAGQPSWKRSALVGGAFAAAGSAVGAIAAPMMTPQERAAQLATRSAGHTAGMAAAAIGEKLGGTSVGIRAGEFAESAVTETMQSRFHKMNTVMGEARGGFADLRQMAAAGFNVNDETLQQRARLNLRSAERGYQFDERMTDALGEEAGKTSLGGGFAKETGDVIEAFRGLLSSLTQVARESQGVIENDGSRLR